MVAHLNAFTPKHCEVIGELAVRAGIRLRIERARRYGLTNCGPMHFYIELMFMYGCDFDGDPQCGWASDVPQRNDFPDQMARADQLYNNAVVFTDKTAGTNHIYAKEALRRAQPARQGHSTWRVERWRWVYPLEAGRSVSCLHE
jgi:hypothetical protein